MEGEIIISLNRLHVEAKNDFSEWRFGDRPQNSHSGLVTESCSKEILISEGFLREKKVHGVLSYIQKQEIIAIHHFRLE